MIAQLLAVNYATACISITFLRFRVLWMLMVEVVYQDLSNKDSQNYYIGIPRNWKYGKDDDVTVVVSDVCVVIPQTIAGATGELKVLRTLEAMLDANVINTGDIQKAIEHVLL